MRSTCRHTSAWTSCGRSTRLGSLPTTSAATSWYLTCIRAEHITSAHCNPDKRDWHGILHRSSVARRGFRSVGSCSQSAYRCRDRRGTIQSHGADEESLEESVLSAGLPWALWGKTSLLKWISRPLSRYKSICLARVLNPAEALWVQGFRRENISSNLPTLPE